MARVTVNIPTYQRDEMLRRAIRSALDQTFTDLEVNVSDNAGSPKIRALVESFDDPRLTYHPLDENIGIYGNLTRCLHLGRAPYVLVLNDDDVLYPGCIEALFGALENAPTAGIAHSALDYIDGEGNVTLHHVNWAGATADTYERSAEFVERTLCGATRICISAALLRRDAVSAERMDPRDTSYGDLGLWLRIARLWDVVYIHRPMVATAIHADAHSAGAGWQQLDEGGKPQTTLRGVSPHQPRDPDARRSQVRLVRGNKERFVRELVPGRRARHAAMKLVRRSARHELKSIIADSLDQRSSAATIRDLRESARIEPTLLLTPWPLVLAAAGVVGRGPYDRLVARRSSR